MIKNILNLEGAHALSANEQKSIKGGGPVQPDPEKCSCFCYSGPRKVNASCKTYCPDGSLPGLNEGSAATCTGSLVAA